MVDMGMTYASLRSNSAIYEFNPLMRGVAYDFEPFFIAKIIGICLVVAIGELMRRSDQASIAHSIVWVAAGFSACVVWSNLIIILASVGI